MRCHIAFLTVSGGLWAQAHTTPLDVPTELDSYTFLPARDAEVTSPMSLNRRDTVCGNLTGVSCPAGQCCGSNGYCGTGKTYCNAPDCQFMFGPACDANIVPRGKDTASTPRPLLGSVQYGGVVITNCAVPGTVAMTYDDGPGPYTAELLDILAKANVKSTFFITGNNNGKGEIDDPNTPWPSIIQRMYREGHQIASHSWSHPSFDNITSAQRKEELVKNEIAFTNILGFFPTYMRPPFTYCQASTGCTSDVASLGYHIVDFMIDTKDYLNTTPDLIQNSKNIFAAAFANANPQTQEYLPYAHDIHEQSVVSLTPYIIDAVQAKGFKMVTVGQCLNDPAENWYRDPTTGGAHNSVPALAASVTSNGLSSSVTMTAAACSICSSSAITSVTTSSSDETVSATTNARFSSNAVVLTSNVGGSTLPSTTVTSIATSHAAATTSRTLVSTAPHSQATPKPTSTGLNTGATRAPPQLMFEMLCWIIPLFL